MKKLTRIFEAKNLLQQAKLSSEEYQLAKKLKHFKAENYLWNPEEQLYTKVLKPIDESSAKIPDYSKYEDQRSWSVAFKNLKKLENKNKKIFDKVIGMIYSISNPTDDDITYIVNKTNDHSKIFDRFDSFYNNPDWMKKFGNINEAVDMKELEETLKRTKLENPKKKVTYFFTKDEPKGYKIQIKEINEAKKISLESGDKVKINNKGKGESDYIQGYTGFAFIVNPTPNSYGMVRVKYQVEPGFPENNNSTYALADDLLKINEAKKTYTFPPDFKKITKKEAMELFPDPDFKRTRSDEFYLKDFGKPGFVLAWKNTMLFCYFVNGKLKGTSIINDVNRPDRTDNLLSDFKAGKFKSDSYVGSTYADEFGKDGRGYSRGMYQTGV